MNGKPQMQGWSDAPDSEHMVDSVFKYLESGRLESVCEHKTYESGWISFFDDKKRRSCRLFCEKQLKNGKATFYNADGSVFSKAVFKNDTMFSGIRPHVICYNHFNPHASVKYKNGKAIEEIKLYPNGKIARKTKLGYGLFSPVSAVFWDEKGKKIGACTFDKHYDKPLDGTFVLGAVRIGRTQALLLREEGGRVLRLAPGGTYRGWRLLGIAAEGATLRKNGKITRIAFGAGAPAGETAADLSESESNSE